MPDLQLLLTDLAGVGWTVHRPESVPPEWPPDCCRDCSPRTRTAGTGGRLSDRSLALCRQRGNGHLQPVGNGECYLRNRPASSTGSITRTINSNGTRPSKKSKFINVQDRKWLLTQRRKETVCRETTW